MAIPCDICGKGAANKAGLKKHKKLRHPEAKPAKRKYTKPTVRTTSIDRSIAKARKLGLFDDPKPVRNVPVLPDQKSLGMLPSVQRLRVTAGELQGKADILLKMADELEKILS